jgi:hypothetical protein
MLQAGAWNFFNCELNNYKKGNLGNVIWGILEELISGRLGRKVSSSELELRNHLSYFLYPVVYCNNAKIRNKYTKIAVLVFVLLYTFATCFDLAKSSSGNIYEMYYTYLGHALGSCLRHYATCWKVVGSSPG